MSDADPLPHAVLKLSSQLQAAVSRFGAEIIEERRVGTKAKRYLHVLDEFERRERNAPFDRNFTDLVAAARRRLLADPVIAAAVGAKDALTWPDENYLQQVVADRAALLHNDEKKDEAAQLRESAELHLLDVLTPGVYLLALEGAGGATHDEKESAASVATASDALQLFYPETREGRARYVRLPSQPASPIPAQVWTVTFPAKQLTTNEVIGARVSAAISAELVAAVGLPQTLQSWDGAVQLHRQCITSQQRNGVFFTFEEFLAVVPHIAPNEIARLLLSSAEASPSGRVRLRPGVFLTAVTIPEVYVVLQLKEANKALDELPQAASAVFQTKTGIAFSAALQSGKVVFATAAAAASGGGLKEAQRKRVVQAALVRCASGLCDVLQAAVGEEIALSSDYVAFRVAFPNTAVSRNRYLLLHGPRVVDKLKGQERLLMELRSKLNRSTQAVTLIQPPQKAEQVPQGDAVSGKVLNPLTRDELQNIVVRMLANGGDQGISVKDIQNHPDLAGRQLDQNEIRATLRAVAHSVSAGKYVAKI